MQYHYKSPAEVRADIQRLQSGQSRKSRVFSIVILDLAILAIVTVFLYNSGFGRSPQVLRSDELHRGNWQLGFELEKSGDQGLLFISTQNRSNHSRLWPPKATALDIQFVDSQKNTITQRFSWNARPIQSQEKVLWRFTIKDIQLDHKISIWPYGREQDWQIELQ
ncbi:MAG: hypothetical protein KDK39_18405 [Leptospiraceae bacterium]|nr:hypothetical protein [Leptospiraceae bacterium]